MAVAFTANDSVLMRYDDGSEILQALLKNGRDAYQTNTDNLTPTDRMTLVKFVRQPHRSGDDDEAITYVNAIATVENDILKLALSTVFVNGLRSKPTVIILHRMAQAPSWFDWASEQAAQSAVLRKDNEGLTSKLVESRKYMGEMIQAKEAQQNELLQRVCALLEGRGQLHVPTEIHTPIRSEIMTDGPVSDVYIKAEEVARSQNTVGAISASMPGNQDGGEASSNEGAQGASGQFRIGPSEPIEDKQQMNSLNSDGNLPNRGVVENVMDASQPHDNDAQTTEDE